jgi:hypothetical protein
MSNLGDAMTASIKKRLGQPVPPKAREGSLASYAGKKDEEDEEQESKPLFAKLKDFVSGG